MDDNNNKIKINMLSMADSVDGQGVGSAYLELMKLLNEDGKNDFEIFLNKGTKYDVIHAHTVEPRNYLKLKLSKNPTVAYVHFLPDTLDGSIKLPKPIFKIFKKYVISFYKSADYLVVVNPIFKKDIAKAGIKEDKITYIPNFVSKEMFYKKTDKEIKDIRKNNDYAIRLQLYKKPETCAYLLKENLAKYRVRKVSISHDKFRKKFKSHYDLFHMCDEKSVLVAAWYTCWNMFYGVLKKKKYEKER